MKHLLTIAALLMGVIGIAQTDCPNPHDSNDDGAVTISDLLDLLGLFGDVDTDQDGIWDSVDACVDTDACNYAADPTESCAYIDVLGICGGGCEGDGDGDGICDDIDTCVGDLDECGVCNGPGPTEVVIEEIIISTTACTPQTSTLGLSMRLGPTRRSVLRARAFLRRLRRPRVLPRLRLRDGAHWRAVLVC